MYYFTHHSCFIFSLYFRCRSELYCGLSFLWPKVVRSCCPIFCLFTVEGCWKHWREFLLSLCLCHFLYNACRSALYLGLYLLPHCCDISFAYCCRTGNFDQSLRVVVVFRSWGHEVMRSCCCYNGLVSFVDLTNRDFSKKLAAFIICSNAKLSMLVACVLWYSFQP